jgi:hypothetical protein
LGQIDGWQSQAVKVNGFLYFLVLGGRSSLDGLGAIWRDISLLTIIVTCLVLVISSWAEHFLIGIKVITLFSNLVT